MTETAEPTPAAEAAKTAETSGANRLTAAQWIEIEAHYERGTMKPMEIVRHYKISGTAMSKHFKKRFEEDGVRIIRDSKKAEAIAEATKAISATTAAATAVSVSSFAIKRKVRIEQVKERLFQMTQAHSKFHSDIVKEIAEGKRTPAACAKDLQALRHSDLLLKGIRENQWALLDIENDIDEEAMPKLIFEDLSAKEIAEIQQGSGDDDDFDLDDLDKGEDDEDDIVVEVPADE